ncbi:MAG: PmoA family protein [Planctomycetes bacterium]|nr:PmoA family protein [Planctomycetota bacterium]MCB9887788.1 PmoA family protein [Planctomycetota bacterium]
MPARHAPLVLIALLAACATAPPARTDLSWDAVPGQSIALRRATATGTEVVWQFHFGDAHHKPCFHPLALPGDRVLTLDMPGDHRWHNGLWFSWKYIDKVNYWENDRQTGRPVGRTTWQLTDYALRDDGTAQLVLELDYAPPDGEAVLAERRVLDVSAPAADGTFAIDWHGEFLCRRACTLDRTPLPGEPGGAANGGYAGLGARLALLDGREANTTLGPVAWNAQNRFRDRAPAFDYSGVLDGQEVGLAILAHPDTVRSPSPWYAIRAPQMSFFMPAVICYGPMALQPGDRFTVRYRVITHPGRWTGPELAAAVAAYVDSSTP